MLIPPKKPKNSIRVIIIVFLTIAVSTWAIAFFPYHSSQILLDSGEYRVKIVLSPDGKTVLIASDKLVLYNIASKETEVFSNQLLDYSRLLEWSKSGKYLCATSGKNLYVWDFSTRRLLYTLRFPAEYITSISFNSTETKFGSAYLSRVGYNCFE